MWAVEHVRTAPDILCVAKTIGGGIPLSLVAYRTDLGRPLPPGFHLGTYRGNPLALAVGAESLKILKDGPWIESAKRRGSELVRRFEEIAQTHPSIGHVRGRGFMVATEYVSDRAKHTPHPVRAKAMREEMFRRGVLMHTCGGFDNVQRFIAPLTIEDELIERGVAVYEATLTELERADTPAVPARPIVRAAPTGPRSLKGPARPPARVRPAVPLAPRRGAKAARDSGK
jgi:4-aminobutyrate aminotransferase-like enzyme